MSSQVLETPLDEIFLSFLTQDDLEGQTKMNEKNITYLEVFNSSFQEFVCNQPELLVRGERERRIEFLQKKYVASKESKERLIADVESQISFFKKSRAELEEMYVDKTDELLSRRQPEQADLREALEAAQKASAYVNEVIPYQAFLNKVDSLAAGHEAHEDASTASRRIRPSTRAIILSNETSGSEYRAYKIEHALLRARLHMLQQQVDMVKKTEIAQAAVEKILI